MLLLTLRAVYHALVLLGLFLACWTWGDPTTPMWLSQGHPASNGVYALSLGCLCVEWVRQRRTQLS